MVEPLDRLGEKVQLLAYCFDRVTTNPDVWEAKQRCEHEMRDSHSLCRVKMQHYEICKCYYTT